MKLESIRARISPEEIEKLKQIPMRHARGELFIHGPISWAWWSQVARLAGKTLHVASVVALLMGIKKARTIKLSGVLLQDLGADRYSTYRALKKLERAQLLIVHRHRGRSPIVTLPPKFKDNFSKILPAKASGDDHDVG